jgi:GTP-binding protein HflX
VFNKIDRLEGPHERERLAQTYPGAIFTSATEGIGLDEVRRAITAFVESREEILDLTVPVGDGRTIALLYEKGEVLSRREHGDHLEIKVRLPVPEASRLRKLGLAG